MPWMVGESMAALECGCLVLPLQEQLGQQMNSFAGK